MSVHEWNQLAIGLALKKFRVAEHNGQLSSGRQSPY